MKGVEYFSVEEDLWLSEKGLKFFDRVENDFEKIYN